MFKPYFRFQKDWYVIPFPKYPNPNPKLYYWRGREISMERMREKKQERIPKNSLQSSTEKNKRERPVIGQKGRGESSDYQR